MAAFPVYAGIRGLGACFVKVIMLSRRESKNLMCAAVRALSENPKGNFKK